MVAIGTQVRVYWNVNKYTYSIQTKQDGRWKVADYQNICLIKNAKFTVRPGGNKKVKETGRKNVHAWVEGELIANHVWLAGNVSKDVVYNPKEHTQFMCNNVPIYEANYCWLGQNNGAKVEVADVI